MPSLLKAPQLDDMHTICHIPVFVETEKSLKPFSPVSDVE